MFPSSINREVRKISRRSCAVTAKKSTKRRDARAKMLFCQCCRSRCRGRRRCLIGSFSIDDGNGSENVSFKMNSRFFQSLSRLFQFAENGKCRRISLELISRGPYSSLKREKEIRRRLFTSSIKLAIRHFHVVVAQGR